MTALVHQRCQNHPAREAVSRCPSCKRFFCRECVIDHEGRLSCAGCLAKLSAPAASKRNLAGLRWGAAALLGLLLGWMCFYYAGAAMARIPSDFRTADEEEQPL